MQDLDLFKLPKGFRGRNAVTVQLWWFVQALFFRLSPRFMYGWRRFLLRLFGAEIGKNVIIRPSVKITYPWKVQIGDFSWVGDDATLYSLGNIRIGAHTVVSQNSYLCAGSHDLKKKNFAIYSKPIVIGDGVWLGTDVFVAPGVCIHDNAVVGARSSVFKDLEGGKIYFGSPAKYVKDRSFD